VAKDIAGCGQLAAGKPLSSCTVVPPVDTLIKGRCTSANPSANAGPISEQHKRYMKGISVPVVRPVARRCLRLSATD